MVQAGGSTTNGRPQNGALQKAKLISEDGGGTIEFMFNPTQLSFRQQVNLTPNKGARTAKGLPKIDFAYPDPCRLSIKDIMLDTYEAGGGKSVLSYLRQFEKVVNFAESGKDKEKRPPTYTFIWGEYTFIHCFVVDLSYTLTLFLPDGTPVRAKVDLELQEVSEFSKSADTKPPANVDRQGDSRTKRSK